MKVYCDTCRAFLPCLPSTGLKVDDNLEEFEVICYQCGEVIVQFSGTSEEAAILAALIELPEDCCMGCGMKLPEGVTYTCSLECAKAAAAGLQKA